MAQRTVLQRTFSWYYCINYCQKKKIILGHVATKFILSKPLYTIFRNPYSVQEILSALLRENRKTITQT